MISKLFLYISVDIIDLIEYYILRRRCKNCRNWHFHGYQNKIPIGNCDMLDCIVWGNDWDYCWGYDANPNTDYEEYDGCERIHTTPNGKKITQRSKGGLWQYINDEEPTWWGNTF